MKRFHFQVHSTVSYDVAEIEAETLEEAYEKLRWAHHKDEPLKIVMNVKDESFEELNSFIGINAV